MPDIRKLLFNRVPLVASGMMQRTMLGSLRVGERLPIILVNEYPKSGGTWIAKVTGGVLGLPFIEDSSLPFALPSITRTAWRPSPNFKPSVYVMRDGRDVMVSLFHQRVRRVREVPEFYTGKRGAFARSLDVDRIEEQLPDFIAYELTNNVQTSVGKWHEHVSDALDHYSVETKGRVLVRFEDMLADSNGTITRIVSELTGYEPSPALVEKALSLVSAQQAESNNLTGRNEASVKRKGKAGGWKGVFTDSSSEVFAKYANEALIAAGYEDDPEWWKVR